MSDTATAVVSPASGSAGTIASKKSAPAKKVTSPKSSRKKPSRPPTSEMVCNAIKALKERGGSSLQAIKKYISVNYKVDAEKVSPFIRKYLKSAVAAGLLVQTKGKGASGSFKLAAPNAAKPATEESGEGYAGRRAIAKTKSAAKPLKLRKKAGVNTAATKKRGSDKKLSSPKKLAIVEKSPRGRLAKSPSKLNRKGSPTKKPKAPKPKKTKSLATGAKLPKKALAKKK